MLDLGQRTDRLNQFIEEGRILRRKWSGQDAHGRETACLLTAWAPEVGGLNPSAGACPAEAMPPWLAFLTPWIDDAGTIGAWPTVVRRFAAVLPRLVALPAETLRRLEYGVRWLALMLGASLTPHCPVHDTCIRVGELCLRVAVGMKVQRLEWDSARNHARGVAFSFMPNNSMADAAEMATSEVDWATLDVTTFATTNVWSVDALIDQVLTLFEYVVA